jgi:hypothetical protein
MTMLFVIATFVGSNTWLLARARLQAEQVRLSAGRSPQKHLLEDLKQSHSLTDYPEEKVNERQDVRA